MPTIGKALRDGAAALKNSPTPMIDARVLLKFALAIDDAALIARGDETMPHDQASIFETLLKRRAEGEPVAYIIGVKEFWSLPFMVTPDVLVPRDDSECLIEAVLARRRRDAALQMLDLGAGSGCLLCALMSEYPNSFGVGVERSAKAAAVARINCERLGFADRARIVVGDWAATLAGGFDVIVANPPYIPDRAKLPIDVAGYEPAGALFAGADGMDAYRAILKAAPSALKPDGLLVFESGEGQADLLAQMLSEALPAAEIFPIYDLKGRERGVGADCRY